MVDLYAGVTREQGLLSAVGRRAARLLGAAMLSGLALATIAVATAAAEPVGAVTINGLSARACGTNPSFQDSTDYCVGSAPLITVLPPSGNPGGSLPDQRFMGVRNDETDGFDEITGVNANINPGPFDQARFKDAFNDSPAGHIPCNPSAGLTIKCATFPTDRGSIDAIDYNLVDSAGNPLDFNSQYGLQTLSVQFNYGNAISPCAGPAAPGGQGSASDTARVAASCRPPSNPKITQATIKRNTAFFKFAAQRATGFECELLRNKQVVFRRACRSPKPYANALPRGNYVFLLTAVNGAGVAPKPAMKKFTVK
jgi:hypothetical protein